MAKWCTVKTISLLYNFFSRVNNDYLIISFVCFLYLSIIAYNGITLAMRYSRWQMGGRDWDTSTIQCIHLYLTPCFHCNTLAQCPWAQIPFRSSSPKNCNVLWRWAVTKVVGFGREYGDSNSSCRLSTSSYFEPKLSLTFRGTRGLLEFRQATPGCL